MLRGSTSHTLEMKCRKGHVLSVASIWSGVVCALVVVLSKQPLDTTVQAMGEGRSFLFIYSHLAEIDPGGKGGCVFPL